MGSSFGRPRLLLLLLAAPVAGADPGVEDVDRRDRPTTTSPPEAPPDDPLPAARAAAAAEDDPPAILVPDPDNTRRAVCLYRAMVGQERQREREREREKERFIYDTQNGR